MAGPDQCTVVPENYIVCERTLATPAVGVRKVLPSTATANSQRSDKHRKQPSVLLAAVLPIIDQLTQ
eukprot:10397585-Alexandrium_andersonii.AAC.1